MSNDFLHYVCTILFSLETDEIIGSQKLPEVNQKEMEEYQEIQYGGVPGPRSW